MNDMVPAQAAAPRTGIRRRDRKERAAGFEALRAQGLQLLQSTSGARWTDHNLHDPGITMLEALCYALTEIVYRAEFPVADVLTGPDGRIDFRHLSLHGPHEAFPCHATTADDYRRLILDRVDGLDDAHLRRLKGDPPGVYRLRLKQAGGAEADKAATAQAALAAFRAERARGEDVAPQADEVQPRRCYLYADIEVSGTQDAAALLASVYHAVAVAIDRSARLVGRGELVRSGLSLEQVYDGPAVQRGFAPVGTAELGQERTLYISTLKALVAALPGVKEVHQLSLVEPGKAPENVSIEWGSDTQALRLQVPGDAVVEEERRLTRLARLRRRNLPIVVADDELARRVQELRAAERAQRFRMAENTRREEVEDLPRGTWRPGRPYVSIQHLFPAIYGLGRHGVPGDSGPLARARVRQLRAYLALFEQVLANGQAQQEHLRDLFSEAGARRRGRWWQLLTEANVPGLGELLRSALPEVEQEVLAPLDRSAARRSRLLDHLLALHGEEFTQNAMRQFCGHLDPDELDALLLANKAAYLRQIVMLSRKRGGGFDYGRPLWGNPGNSSVMARRACLLMGFRLAHARPLLGRLHEAGLELDADAVPDLAADLPAEALTEVPRTALAPPRDGGRIDPAAVLRSTRGGRLPAGLLRAGASHEGWRVLRSAGELRGSSPTLTLLVRAEAPRPASAPAGRGWWRVAELGSEDEAAGVAAAWRDFMRRLNDGCEGLHLVEHVLLRALAGRRQPRLLPRYSITAVLPDWTVRTHQQDFVHFARQTLRINCPAHLALDVQFLGPARMATFELAYGTWLDARRLHAQQPEAAHAAAADAAAARVAEELALGRPRRRARRQPEFEEDG